MPFSEKKLQRFFKLFFSETLFKVYTIYQNNASIILGKHWINHVLRTEYPPRLPFLVKLHSNHLKYVSIPAWFSHNLPEKILSDTGTRFNQCFPNLDLCIIIDLSIKKSYAIIISHSFFKNKWIVICSTPWYNNTKKKRSFILWKTQRLVFALTANKRNRQKQYLNNSAFPYRF